MEQLRVSAVTDDAMAVSRFLVKAVGHAVEAVVGAEEAGVHELGGFRAKDLLVAEFAVLEMGDHEIAHVESRGGDAARGKSFDEFKRLGLLRRFAIAARHQGQEIGRERLHEGGSLHVQRRVDMFGDVLREGLAGDALDDVSGMWFLRY